MKNIKNHIFVFAAFFFVLIIFLYPKNSITAASEGLILWFNNVLPSLFPFMVGINIIFLLGGDKTIGGLFSPIMNKLFGLPSEAGFAFISGLISGYPVGAKVISDLREKNILSRNEAEIAMSFSNNPSPVFVVATVATKMLGESKYGYPIFTIIILASMTTGIIFRLLYKPGKHLTKKKCYNFHPEKNILGKSISSALETVALVGGYIIFFSVLIEILNVSGILNISVDFINALKLMPEKQGYAFLTGIAEMTNGCLKTSLLNMDINLKLSLITFILSWGGFSIIAQILNIISKTDIRPQRYVFAKVLNSIFSTIYSLIFFSIFEVNSSIPASVFYDNRFTNLNINTSLLYVSAFIITLHLALKILQKRKNPRKHY